MSDRALLGVVLVLALVLIVLAGGIAKLSLFDAGEGVPGARHHAQLGPVVFRSNGGMTEMRGKTRYFRPGKDSEFAAGELGA